MSGQYISIERIKEIRAEIEAKKRRLDSMKELLKKNKAKLLVLEEQLRKEKKDVDDLEKTSLSNFLKKLTNTMDEKYAKEQQEYLQAKISLDELRFNIEQNEKEMVAFGIEVSNLERDYKETEEKARRESHYINDYFTQKESGENEARCMIKEIDEAIAAGKRTTTLIWQAASELKDAKSWATYDMFTRGGLISHMAKYGHIDKAQNIMNAINYNLKNFQKELNDVGSQMTSFGERYGQTIRVIDFFFDNIFTDINVRRKITEDIESLDALQKQIYAKISELEKLKKQVETRLKNFV